MLYKYCLLQVDYCCNPITYIVPGPTGTKQQTTAVHVVLLAALVLYYTAVTLSIVENGSCCWFTCGTAEQVPYEHIQDTRGVCVRCTVSVRSLQVALKIVAAKI